MPIVGRAMQAIVDFANTSGTGGGVSQSALDDTAQDIRSDIPDISGLATNDDISDSISLLRTPYNINKAYTKDFIDSAFALPTGETLSTYAPSAVMLSQDTGYVICKADLTQNLYGFICYNMSVDTPIFNLTDTLIYQAVDTTKWYTRIGASTQVYDSSTRVGKIFFKGNSTSIGLATYSFEGGAITNVVLRNDSLPVITGSQLSADLGFTVRGLGSGGYRQEGDSQYLFFSVTDESALGGRWYPIVAVAPIGNDSTAWEARLLNVSAVNPDKEILAPIPFKYNGVDYMTFIEGVDAGKKYTNLYWHNGDNFPNGKWVLFDGTFSEPRHDGSYQNNISGVTSILNIPNGKQDSLKLYEGNRMMVFKYGNYVLGQTTERAGYDFRYLHSTKPNNRFSKQEITAATGRFLNMFTNADTVNGPLVTDKSLQARAEEAYVLQGGNNTADTLKMGTTSDEPVVIIARQSKKSVQIDPSASVPFVFGDGTYSGNMTINSNGFAEFSIGNSATVSSSESNIAQWSMYNRVGGNDYLGVGIIGKYIGDGSNRKSAAIIRVGGVSSTVNVVGFSDNIYSFTKPIVHTSTLADAKTYVAPTGLLYTGSTALSAGGYAWRIRVTNTTSYVKGLEVLGDNANLYASFGKDSVNSLWIGYNKTNGDAMILNGNYSINNYTIGIDSLNGDVTIQNGANGADALVIDVSEQSISVTNKTTSSYFNSTTTLTPSSTADGAGTTGDIRWDDNYIYIKTSAGWKRSALTTWP